jgi:hypothetical protein
VATDSTTALNETQFTPTLSALTGFGGGKTGWIHFGSSTGSVEQTPHNVVHVQVGGWMTDPNRAALDPVFWLHHANIDRLWELWIRQGHTNTADAAWPAQQFLLFDDAGNQITMTAADVISSEDQLGYTYEGLPALPPPPGGGFGLAPDEEGEAMPDDGVPAELRGASARPVVLGAEGDEAQFSLVPSARPRRRGLDDDVRRRVFLTVDNVTADGPPSTSYDVVLDMGTPDDPRDDYLVGVVAPFGVVEASSVENGEPHGMRFTFDVTDVVEKLTARGHWNEDAIRVTFRPIEEVEDDEPTEITIGRIGLYFE